MKPLELEAGNECKFVLCGDEPQSGIVVSIEGDKYVIRDSEGTEYSGRAYVSYRVGDGTLKAPVVNFSGFQIIKVGEKSK